MRRALRRSTLEAVPGTYLTRLHGISELRGEIERYRTTCEPYLEVMGVNVEPRDVLVVVEAMNSLGKWNVFEIILDKDHPTVLLRLLQEMEDGTRSTMPLFTVDPSRTFFLTKPQAPNGLPGGYRDDAGVITFLYCRELVDALLYALRFM